MYKSGHTGLSLLFYSPLLYLFIEFNELAFASIGLIIIISYSSVPDLDFKVPGVKHRGYSHSLIGAVIIALPMSIIAYFSYIYLNKLTVEFGGELAYSPMLMSVFAFILAFFAVLTHYAGDIVTPSGIPILAPVSKKKYSLNLFYAKNKLANGLSLFLGISATLTVVGMHIYSAF